MRSEKAQSCSELKTQILELGRELEALEIDLLLARRENAELMEAFAQEAQKKADDPAFLEWFGQWIAEQRAAGRPEAELTWGNCVHESGIWLPDPAQ